MQSVTAGYNDPAELNVDKEKQENEKQNNHQPTGGGVEEESVRARFGRGGTAPEASLDSLKLALEALVLVVLVDLILAASESLIESMDFLEELDLPPPVNTDLNKEPPLPTALTPPPTTLVAMLTPPPTTPPARSPTAPTAFNGAPVNEAKEAPNSASPT
ncbi:hypothetical protein WICPIJ_008907 [Wickerhamomyces pijperi]|uniref:Uncharacterized protein n=1 Tax=Wickerhamomyces pijperi TaxID=599730 RepID=A0A9P8PVK3_WICPI|nr:hypothetical protein WICPIJ_008907 [Wickerhamomyces pijperi]